MVTSMGQTAWYSMVLRVSRMAASKTTYSDPKAYFYRSSQTFDTLSIVEHSKKSKFTTCCSLDLLRRYFGFDSVPSASNLENDCSTGV